MTEEYDVFGDLDLALCSDDAENFKNIAASVAPSQNNNDEDLIMTDDFLDSSAIKAKTCIMQDSSREDLIDIQELCSSTSSGSSKVKKKTKGKKSSTSVKNTLPSPGYGFSSTLAKRTSPVRVPSPAELLSPVTQDLLSPAQSLLSPTIDQTTALRRLTRSMRRVVSSSPVAIVPPDAAPHQVPQTQSGRARKKNRGGKRQTQTAMGNQLLMQPLAQDVAATLEMLRDLSRQNTIQQTFNRRDYAALMAAQSINVAYVDLVSSPVPRIDGVITVDSDTEENTETTKDLVTANSKSVEADKSIDISFDEENPEISVKVIWNGNPETFTLRKYQKFATMFETIAQREDIDEKNIVFNINNKILSANDTPASINYKIFQFINGRVLISKFNSPITNGKKKREANKILLKIQSDQFKRPMQVELLKTEKFKILYIKCAEELKIPYENLKLSFDGESLEFDGTPADLDLEGGEAIDLRIKK